MHALVPTSSEPSSPRLLSVARALWGAALLIVPGTVLGELPHQRIDRPARAFARVLGARHIVQAAIASRRHTRGWILAGAALDGTHAATMVVLAGLRPDRRKLALSNTATASMFAVAGVYQAGHSRGRARGQHRLTFQVQRNQHVDQ